MYFLIVVVVVFFQAFANMTQNVRRALCAVMVFAVVEKAGSVVMENGEEVLLRDLLVFSVICYKTWHIMYSCLKTIVHFTAGFHIRHVGLNLSCC